MTDFDEILRRTYSTFDGPARQCAWTLVELAIAEDLGSVHEDHPSGPHPAGSEPGSEARGDLTSDATIPPGVEGSGIYVTRGAGVIAGLPVLHMVAHRCGLGEGFRPLAKDGDPVNTGTPVARVTGPLRSLLLMERTGLNFLQRLSGVATLTSRFVLEAAGTPASILDTRKTTPGWRAIEKYAVRCGGGLNHRFGLYDMVLIKDNHLAALADCGKKHPIREAVTSARQLAPQGTLVEVEVDSLDQFDQALEVLPDIILVDNLRPESLAEAARRRDQRAPSVLLEASGGVTLATVGVLARTGVDRISVGALTHSAPALDIGLDFERLQRS